MDTMTFWTAAIALFTALTALFTAVAAGASWWAVARVRQAMEADVLVTLAQAFGSPEMTGAHDLLSRAHEVHDKYGTGWAGDLKQAQQEGNEVFKNINAARRKIAHHYQLIYNLIKIRRHKVPDEFVKALVSRDQALFYREVIEPLECEINADYDRESFEYFGKLYGIPRFVQPMKRPGG